MPRKRTRDEMETASEPPAQAPQETSLIHRIRNMWEFASVMQYIHTFGKAVKLDNDFDIQDFEEECLKPEHSEKLEEIGLTLLKWISSHRGLDLNNWNDYTRRQYLAKATNKNPYGDEEKEKQFRDFDIFLKIRVLHQLTVWTFNNPDKIRERMPDHPTEGRQTEWRMEAYGWDRDDRTYYLLDDDRLYRRTEPPLPPAPKAKPKATSKKAQAARRRASKRQRIEESETPDVDDSVADENAGKKPEEFQGTPSGPDADTFGGFKWECVAITLSDYQELVDSWKRTKDLNEQDLRDRLISDIIPIIEAAEDKQRRKIERRERELLAMEKMQHAKRSSRLAGKAEREKAERDAIEAERKHAADLAAARRDQEEKEQMENARQSRMMTREQRIKDREFKRILAEEELARQVADKEAIDRGEARGSERQIKDRLARSQKKLEEIKNEDEWTFDCSGCGVYGKNVDDGSHSISCERCNVWQHSKCLHISEKDAERDDFHFICQDCRKKDEEASRPKIKLQLKMGQSSSPPQQEPRQPIPSPKKQNFAPLEVPRYHAQQPAVNGYYQQNGTTYGPRPPYPTQNGHAAPSYSPIAPNPADQRSHPFVMSPYQGAHQSPPLQPLSPAYPAIQPGQQWGYPPPPQHYSNQRPGSSSYQNGSPSSNANLPNGYSQFPQVRSPHAATPAMNGHPSSSEDGVRPPSAGQINGQQTPAARLPSPVVNRPIITPSQGNYDVGPVAGIPQYNQQPTPQNLPVGTPTPSLGLPRNGPSSSPPLSGVSPVKHAPSVPPSMSGTPVFPPAAKLAPSPEQGPVPTPSKQDSSQEHRSP